MIRFQPDTNTTGWLTGLSRADPGLFSPAGGG
jgi:hypothetical protein